MIISCRVSPTLKIGPVPLEVIIRRGIIVIAILEEVRIHLSYASSVNLAEDWSISVEKRRIERAKSRWEIR